MNPETACQVLTKINSPTGSDRVNTKSNRVTRREAPAIAWTSRPGSAGRGRAAITGICVFWVGKGPNPDDPLRLVIFIRPGQMASSIEESEVFDIAKSKRRRDKVRHVFLRAVRKRRPRE